MTLGEHWWADLMRLVMCTAALWLGLLVLRLAWKRMHDPLHASSDHPHVCTYLSYAGAMILLAALRIEHVGDVPTWDLYVAFVLVGLGVYGVTRRVRFETPLVARRGRHGDR